MYAFKTERPDAARRYHKRFTSGTAANADPERRFALTSANENIFRKTIL